MLNAPEMAYTVHHGIEPSDAAASQWPDYNQALAQAVSDYNLGLWERILVRGANGQVMWDSAHKLDAYIEDVPQE